MQESGSRVHVGCKSDLPSKLMNQRLCAQTAQGWSLSLSLSLFGINYANRANCYYANYFAMIIIFLFLALGAFRAKYQDFAFVSLSLSYSLCRRNRSSNEFRFSNQSEMNAPIAESNLQQSRVQICIRSKQQQQQQHCKNGRDHLQFRFAIFFNIFFFIDQNFFLFLSKRKKIFFLILEFFVFFFSFFEFRKIFVPKFCSHIS